jgi:hypothetical protein
MIASLSMVHRPFRKGGVRGAAAAFIGTRGRRRSFASSSRRAMDELIRPIPILPLRIRANAANEVPHGPVHRSLDRPLQHLPTLRGRAGGARCTRALHHFLGVSVTPPFDAEVPAFTVEPALPEAPERLLG